MRTSNKILIGLILTAILLFAGLFITVRVKYANGAIVKREGVNSWSEVHRLQGTIKSVSISRLNNIMIVPSDSAKLEIWKENEGRIKWRIQDGVLYVERDTARYHGQKGGYVVNGHVELFLPNVDSIIAVKSNIVVKNVQDSGAVNPVYNFQLDESELAFENNNRNEQATFYDAIKVNAGFGSGLRFRGRLWVNDLQARLVNTEFEDGEASFGKLRLQTDKSSSIHLDGRNLLKATITSTE